MAHRTTRDHSDNDYDNDHDPEDVQREFMVTAVIGRVQLGASGFPSALHAALFLIADYDHDGVFHFPEYDPYTSVMRDVTVTIQRSPERD